MPDFDTIPVPDLTLIVTLSLNLPPNYLSHEALLLRQAGGVAGVSRTLLGALGPAEADQVRGLGAEGARRLLAAVPRGHHLRHGSSPHVCKGWSLVL